MIKNKRRKPLSQTPKDPLPREIFCILDTKLFDMENMFDTYIMVDWSAKDEPGPQERKEDRQKKDNIWIAEGGHVDGKWTVTETYCRTRQRAKIHLEQRLTQLVKEGNGSSQALTLHLAIPSDLQRD